MWFIVALAIAVVMFFIYVEFIWPNKVYKKVYDLKRFGFDVSEKPETNPKSKYMSTTDCHSTLTLTSTDKDIYLLSMNTHGQLKSIMYICYSYRDAEANLEGVYGGGRIPRAAKRYKLGYEYWKKSDYAAESIDKLITLSESIEVNDSVVFCYIPIGSFSDASNIDGVESCLKNSS